MRLVLLLSVAAVASAQNPAPIRLIYAVSGKPAAGVAVEVSRAGVIARYTADSAGRITAAVAPGQVHITDPKTQTVLLSRGFSAEPKEIEIGIPIRVTGQVTGFGSDPARLEVDCAYGERMAVSDYERMVQKLDIRPRQNEDTVHGMALPRVPGGSLRTHPDAAGHFTTGWFAALDPPELLVFGGPDGRSGAKTVRLARNIQPGTTVSAGSITPSFGATLEIKVNAPKTDLPLGLLMGVESLTPAAAAKTQTAELLSTIHRQNVNLSQFLLMRRTIPLNFDGVTTLTGLPPIEALKLAFNGPSVGIRAERTVKIPDRGVVRIELTAEELLGKQQPRIPYTGRVRFVPDGGPVAGATLVYSSYPDRYETTTGPDGRFGFPAVSANRGGILFIDAPNPGGRPPFDRFTVTRTVAPLAPGSNTEQIVDIPKPSASANVLQISAPLDPAPSRALLRGGGQLGDFPYVFNGCTNGFTQADLEFSKGPVVTIWEYDGKNLHGPVQGIFGKAQIFPDGSALAQVQFPKPGSYDVFLELTPFVFTAMVVWVKETAQVLTFPPPQSLEEVTIEVYGKDGKPAPANVELTFPTYSPDLDPYTAVTDAMSRVYLFCVTRSPNVPLPVVTVEVDDPVSGYFDGELELPASGSSVLLTLELTTKPKKTESSKSKK